MEMENTRNMNRKDNIIHKTFEVNLILKAIHAIMEIIAGFLLIFITPDRLNNFIGAFSREEISRAPIDIVMDLLVKAGSNFSVSTQQFGIFYLLSHGIVKLTIVYLLFKEKIWAYPALIVMLIAFIITQIHRFFLHHSIFMIIFTIWDIAIIYLTYKEYKRLKKEKISKETS